MMKRTVTLLLLSVLLAVACGSPAAELPSGGEKSIDITVYRPPT